MRAGIHCLHTPVYLAPFVADRFMFSVQLNKDHVVYPNPFFVTVFVIPTMTYVPTIEDNVLNIGLFCRIHVFDRTLFNKDKYFVYPPKEIKQLLSGKISNIMLSTKTLYSEK